MSRIFISYKRADKEKVFKIKDQIESALGEKCWIDVDGIESDAFSQITLNAIEDASIVLFFYGKDTENSQWQRREIEYAKANGKPVIPIIIDEVPEDSWYKIHFDNSLLIKYADERCAELILKKNFIFHKRAKRTPYCRLCTYSLTPKICFFYKMVRMRMLNCIGESFSFILIV